jgi:hypothetical protein
MKKASLRAQSYGIATDGVIGPCFNLCLGDQVKRYGTYICYAKGLLWIALLIAVCVGVSLVVQLIFVDFIHGNPHRTRQNVLLMMLFTPPLLGVIAIIGTFLVFTFPQLLQAALADLLVRHFGRRAQFCITMALPVTALLTWYCYDYLVPSDVNFSFIAGPDWRPYEHGLTLKRYLTMLAIETSITLFSLAYCNAIIRQKSRRPVLLPAVVLTVAIGATWGYWQALNQYKFL